MHALYLIEPGPRPFCGDVASHLWGSTADFDSDGNADHSPAGGWTELTVILRPDYDQRVDIDPLDDGEPLVLVIRSEDEELAKRAALFLQSQAGGSLSDTPPRSRAISS